MKSEAIAVAVGTGRRSAVSARRALAAAARPRRIGSERMLVIDRAAGAVRDARIADLPGLLAPGDVVVVNDAATLPASLAGVTDRGEPIELRLVGPAATDGGSSASFARWTAVLFGAGDYRIDTDVRVAPPVVRAGDGLVLAGGLRARVAGVGPGSSRLVTVELDRVGPAALAAIYRAGRPVQYSYVPEQLALSDVQTVFASEPWAVEMPSAARPLSLASLIALRRRGLALARVTHAAGLSATGDAAIDRALPLPERYRVPAETVQAIARAKDAGRRVVAIGTTTVRALEGAARAAGGALTEGEGTTDLVLHGGYAPRVVDALLTNVHAPGESHFELMEAFASRALLDRAYERAIDGGYLAHELGDATLIV